MLRLEYREGGQVDHGVAGAQQKGAARIGPVAKGLDKPVAVQHAQLGVVVLPVSCLRGPHASQPHQVGLVVPSRKDGGEIVRWAPVQAPFQTEIVGFGIAGRKRRQVQTRGDFLVPAFPGPHLLRVDVIPLRPCIVPCGYLVAHPVSDLACVANRSLAQIALSVSEMRARALRRKGRVGNNVHDPVGAVGPVQRRSRPQDHLDAFHVVAGNGNEIRGVHPHGRHPGKPVVRHHKKRAGEYAVEAAHHDAAVGQSGFREINRRQVFHVVGDVH